MSKLQINSELKTIEVSIIILDALKSLGLDFETITISELYEIKQGLFKGIEKANRNRKIISQVVNQMV